MKIEQIYNDIYIERPIVILTFILEDIGCLFYKVLKHAIAGIHYNISNTAGGTLREAFTFACWLTAGGCACGSRPRRRLIRLTLRLLGHQSIS